MLLRLGLRLLALAVEQAGAGVRRLDIGIELRALVVVCIEAGLELGGAFLGGVEEGFLPGGGILRRGEVVMGASSCGEPSVLSDHLPLFVCD